MAKTYSEASIRVLKGLEPVKQRPGMYTHTVHPLHILQEVVDNSADEALAGHARNIIVTQHSDGSTSVADDGRGIPFGLHPEEGISVLELVFTRLHAGGKFDKQGDGAYSFAGGLHGVGVSVTNALSERLEVQVKREGKQAHLVFADGEPQGAIAITPLPRGDNSHGSWVRVWPRAKYFESLTLPRAELERLLRSKALLLPGLRVTLVQEKNDERQSWFYDAGIAQYLRTALPTEPLIPLIEHTQYLEESDNFAKGEGLSVCLAFTEDGALLRESYVNLIPTPLGGTHEAGLRDALFQAVRDFAELHSLMPKGVRLAQEDVAARLSFVLSVKVLDPQFQGQTKERLNSRDALKLVSVIMRPALELWLNQHVAAGRQLAELVIAQAQSRLRAAQKVERRKGSGMAVLPGKLTDCESRDLRRNELFIVEGDSAGGSAKLGRDKECQAILPLRGKLLNTWEVARDQLFANNEAHDLAVALGVDPHGQQDTPDLSGLRYGKVCILSDADIDGAHIQVLLLTLFFRHFPKLIETGHVYVAHPPLFRLDLPARGKKPARKLYAIDEEELAAMQDKLIKEGYTSTSWSVSRFKGLGEMNADQLWETTLNPDTRRLRRVHPDEGLDPAHSILQRLMGKNEAAARRALIEEFGDRVEVDV